jgi:hypothetical protein
MRVNGDSGGGTLPTVTVSTEDKDKLAQEAMEEYNDSWLNTIAEIRQEGEEDKDKMDIQK